MARTDPEALAALAEVEAELNTRWPESKIDPTLARIAALVDLLGNPQRAYPVLQIAGTNGKTSVARMADTLLRALGVRSGRFTSPHLQTVTERISIDGRPISADGYVAAYRDIEPYLSLVDGGGEVPVSKFEALAAMAYAAFADAPVDAAVVEVGLGGRWDATNVVDAKVAAITAIGLDHAEYLGTDLAGIGAEKAGIVKPESIAVVGEQRPEVLEAILRHCVDVDATVARAGEEFGVLEREVAVGGQRLQIQGLGGVYDDIVLPVHGEHQAANAALALASVEAFFGAGRGRQLDVDAVRDAFSAVRTPGRLEPVRSAPTVLLDAAHNPLGARALVSSLDAEFAFRKLVGVIGVMADKDATGILAELEPALSEVVLTRSSSPRALDPDTLAGQAKEIFGDERIVVEPRLDDALTTAIRLAEESDEDGQVAGAGVLVTGSVVTVGEARALLGKEPE